MKMLPNFDQAITMGRLWKGTFATATGATVSVAPPVQEIHWLQIAALAATAFAGLATGGCAILRLWHDWRKRPEAK